MPTEAQLAHYERMRHNPVMKKTGRAAAARQWTGPVHRERMAELNADPKWQAKRTASVKEFWADPEHVKAQSDKAKKRMDSDPSLAANLKAAAIKRWAEDDAYRAKMQALAADPEHKAKIIKGLQDKHPNFLKYKGQPRDALSHVGAAHGRVAGGKAPSIFWPRNGDGYAGFRAELGPKPVDGQKWSVGRIDHDKGYEPSNIHWQLFGENAREARKRAGARTKPKLVDRKTPFAGKPGCKHK
jgi:hypothetical protein